MVKVTALNNITTMETTFMNFMIPEEMENYLAFYGYHFNKKLCDFAVSHMMRDDKTTGALKKITPITMEELKPLLEKNKVDVENNAVYDALYIANMVKADFLGSSVEDEAHLAKYVEDVICDADGYDGMVFNRFVADCYGSGKAIFWDMML